MKCLLHTCCAPCGGQVIQELKKQGYEVTCYFYNPNIYPAEEYELRLGEVEKYCKKEKVELIKGEYDHHAWLEKIKGYEKSPEKGERCVICIMLRLGETAQLASENKFDAIATTLTISPHKDSNKINEIGKEMSELYGLKFIDKVWRKEEGFKKSCVLAEKEGFHRQSFCGCEFSK